MQDFIKDFGKKVGKQALIKGWVYNFRSSGKIVFLQVRDGSGFCQAIVDQKVVDAESWKIASNMTIESSVEIKGKVAKHPKKDEYELQVGSIKFVQKAEEYSIGKKEHGPDFLLKNRHLWLRSPKQWAILRIRDEIIWSLRKYMHDNNFVLVDAPILTRTACEGTTDLFHVDYFGDDAYLSQSGQLYTEACEYSLGKTYCFGPTFRAEKSKTRKHLTEFWMIEPEVPFMEFEDLMDFEEDFLWNVIQSVLKKKRPELKMLERDIQFLENIKRPFERITYHEAIKILQETGESTIKVGDDLGADDETILTKKFNGPVFVHRFPTSLTNFFMEPDPVNPKLTLNVDLLAPEGYGELIGGGAQRSVDLNLIEKRIKEQKIKKEDYQWYLDLIRFGGMPHCGFGMGLERCVAWLCGIQHVREAIPFPRTVNRIYP
ncbi:asparagine--tRNA ligase [Candidatus Falkowbacteria bacterium]|nr:asparagine--tRNA ligase [Candidatus Falkowbacteria bacterium]